MEDVLHPCLWDICFVLLLNTGKVAVEMDRYPAATFKLF